MFPLSYKSWSALITTILAIALSACGSNDSADKTVATIGRTKINQRTLSHWMSSVIGSDYRAVIGSTAPVGLVSDPPDYARCVSVAARLAPKGTQTLNAVQLRVKCRELYAAAKEQALSYVISVLWRTEEAAEL